MTAERICIEQLRYVRLGTSDLAAAVDFAQKILGLQLIGRSDGQAFLRSDDRDHTLVYVAGSDAQAVGLEVRDIEGLAAAEAALAAAGYPAQRGSAADCVDRKVKALLGFNDASGNRIELVVRPLHSGWRYVPSRDAGVTGLAAVALRGPHVAADERLLTTVLSGRVRDWVGDAAYIGFDEVHHRLAIHPAGRAGVLAVEFSVEGVDQLMQSWYFLNQSQVRIAHGPGRRPTSGQLFVTFHGPDDVLYSYVAEGTRIADDAKRPPRQFARTALSFCAWGSDSEVAEFR